MKAAGAQARQSFDFSRSAVSRYLQLAGLFRRRIASGQWAIGQQIPTVEELVAECGVARATIRQALDLIEAEGLIERHRAKGTFVIARPQQQIWCEVATDWSGLLMSRDGAVIKVMSDKRGIQPSHIPHPIGEPAPSYRHLRRLHSRDDAPFLVTELFVDERLSGRITDEALVTKTALRLLADIPGLQIKDARQTLTIGTADMEIAERLQLPLNAPVACVHRSVADQTGCLVFIGEGIYRGDVVRIDMKLR
ncbi:MAG: GntR family transcriptional regulator [Rhizobiales bacterium]|nr:GntR family transcriptional regulator [Hyphomicrobiales bacterium]